MTTRYVSTGHLPEARDVAAILAETHAEHAGRAEGQVSGVYPALARADPSRFGLCLVGVGGAIHMAGDALHPFSIMSVSKPFVMALVCQSMGWEAFRAAVGANATGRAFNSFAGIEASADGRTNPMVNSGAIATTSLVPGADVAARWRFIQEGLSRFAGRDLALDEEVLTSATETNFRNRGIACFRHARGRISGDAMEAVDLYTRQCALSVTARDLAVMGATLADGGVNPITRAAVVDAPSCRQALAVMATAGMYETSGDWLCDVGLPGKSGIGGGIVTVSPGKGGMGAFSPPLDAAGNSVRGSLAACSLAARSLAARSLAARSLAARSLAERLGLDLFISAPAV